MNHLWSTRTLIMLAFVVIFTFGLTSCVLPASEGPQSTSDGFPVPGESSQTPGINVSIFATQTAHAARPVVVTPPPTVIIPTATEVPVATTEPPSPTPTLEPIFYVTATPGGPPATYILLTGEYPYCIARRFDVSIAELLSLNNMTLDTLTSPGQELLIPQDASPFEGLRTLHEHPTTYQIQAGDTLGSIACYFGDLSPDIIALQNNLSLDSELPVGEVLIIP